MKQPKLKLKELEVRSFVTKLSFKNKQTLLGGDPTEDGDESLETVHSWVEHCNTVTSTGVVVGRRGSE